MSKIDTGSEVYEIDIWIHEEPDRERFVIGFQISGDGGKLLASTDDCVISYEFINDELGNVPSEEYLKNDIYRMAKMYIQKIIKQGNDQSHTIIRTWLKEAKKEV